MIAGDTVKLALRNLGEAKLRTSLTMLGVAIGIASLGGHGVALAWAFRINSSAVF